jgi:2-keto-4-pentenoate hydratase
MIDPRIVRGTRAMLALRAERLAAGERPIGWKVGFGAPAAMERLGTDRPLAGFLTDRGLLADGASVSLAGWTNPVIELEVAVHLGAAGAVRGFSAAIELADVDAPPDDPEQIAAGNIYHRHVIVGPRREHAAVAAASLQRDGEEIARTGDTTALTGDPLEVVRQTRELLAACGETLHDGDLLITGSVFPPIPVGAARLRAELTGLGALRVTLVSPQT